MIIETDEMYEQLLSEPLFEAWATTIDTLLAEVGLTGSTCRLWMEAKKKAVTILNSKNIAITLNKKLLEAREKRNHKDYGGVSFSFSDRQNEFYNDLSCACIYTMIYLWVHEDSRFFDCGIDINVFVCRSDYDIEIMQHLRSVTDNIDNGTISKDYDYSLPDGGQSQKGEQEDAGEADSLTEFPKDLHEKVKMETLARLLEASGVNFNQRGVKAEAARFMNRLTGMNEKGVKNYLTLRDLDCDGKDYRDEIDAYNSSLKKMGVNWSLRNKKK